MKLGLRLELLGAVVVFEAEDGTRDNALLGAFACPGGSKTRE